MAIRRKYGIIFTLSLMLCVALLFTGISFSQDKAYADEQVYPTQMNRAELPFSRLSGFYADFKNNISNKNMSVSETLYGIDLSIEKASGTMYPYWTKGSSNYFTIRIGNQVKVKATNGDRVYGLCLNGRTSLNATSSDTNLTKGEPKIVVTANTGEVVINGHYIGWTGNASEVIFTFSLGPSNTNTYATYEFDKIVMWSSSENIPTPSEPTVKGDVSALVAGMNTADAKTVYFGQGSTYHYPENPEVAPLAWKVVGYNGEGVASKPGTMTLMADEIFFYDLYVDRNYDYGGTTSGREKHPYGVSNAHKRLTEIAGTFSNAEKNAIYERALFDTLQAAYDAKLWMPSESEVYQLHESIRSTKTFSTRTYTATNTGKGSLITYGSSGWGANSIYYGNDHYIRPMVMIDLSKVESVSEGSDGIFTFNFVQPPHAHNWEYELSSDGEKLIATCSEQGCPSSVQELFLDILDKNYDKLATNAIINTNNWQANDLLDVSGIAVKYVGVNGTNYAETTTAPENAGTYKAKLTVGDYTIEKQYTISPISVSIPGGMNPESADVELFRTLNPQSYEIQWWMGKAETYSGNKNVVYDGNAHAVVYTQTSKNNGVDWYYSYLVTTGGKIVFSVDDMDGPWTINPTITDAGVHKVYWKIEASNGNYIGTEADEDNFIYGIIEQAESVITTAPTAKSSLVYNGTAQNLINAGSVNGGYLVYKLGANGSYSANIPQATNAGEYDVYYKVYSDGNYSGIVGSESNKVRVTIAKGQSVVTSAPTVKTNLTYNGSLQTLINAGETNGGELVYKLGENGTYSSALPQALNVGEYEVYYKVLGNDNLNGIEESSQNKVVITIAKGQSVVTSAPTVKTTLTYNGSLQTLINAGETNGGELVYKLGESGTYSSVLPQALNAGEYEVYYKVLGNDNFNGIEESSQNKVVITIAKGQSVVTSAPTVKTNLTYNGSLQTLINAGETNGGELVYKLGENGTYSPVLPQALNAGEYEVYYKVLGNDNLNGIEESSQNKVVITIAKAVRPQMPALSKQSLTDTTVTLNQITGIEDGEIEYGYCLTENGEFVYGNSNVITSLDDNQTYYFRYRVVNSANYEVYVSSAISAKTNSSDVTAPQITGANEQDRYCTAQTLTIIEDNLLFVKVDGIDVTANLVDGKITLGVKNEAQVVLVSDIAGNTATVTVKIFGHEESAWIVDSAPKIGQNGEKHTECLHCGESIKTAQIDALVANAEQDANVQKQDPVIEQNAPATEIKNNISEIRESVLTTEDEEAIANGATINVYIEVKVITESVEQETINKVVEKVGANVDVVYLDLSLFKKVGEENATSVHELNKKIKISVVVPDSIKAEGRTYQIVRVHDGVAEIISGEYNEQSGEFTFETDRFSTYALTYVPEKASINSGLIIGIIVGGVVLAGIAVGIVLILNKRKKA